MSKKKKDLQNEELNDQAENKVDMTIDDNSVEIEFENKKEDDAAEEEKAEEIEEASDEVNKLKQECNDLKDSMLRRAAEFENYKRRTENEISELLKYAAEGFILKVLPIYTDLERALEHIDEPNNIDSIKEGYKMVFNNFKKVLEEQGVKKIEAKGEEFDFNLHEALMQQPSADVPHHTVLDEIEPGFMYKDKVIKHAKVIVSQEIIKDTPDAAEADQSNEEEKTEE